MFYKTTQPDSLKVLSSTKRVLESSVFVEINPEKIKEISGPVLARLKKGISEEEYGLGATGDIKTDLQLIFLEDVVNFCFWAEKDKQKWQVEWPKGNIISGGCYGLKGCFERARAENVPILEAGYLASMTLEETKSLFRSSSGEEIPLIQKRQENLNEAGEVLLKNYQGHFSNLVEASGGDAVRLVKLVCKGFSSFRDVAVLKGKKVYFFKRGQIVANDVFSYLFKNGKKIQFKNIDQLTAFSDYKLPQILREFGVLVYSRQLAKKIDNYVLIPAGSREEVEIRAATIWAVELMRQRLKKYRAGQIDNALWLLSQDMPRETRPYHRTYTIFY